MVNLLRFVEKGILDSWFVIQKPFGLPTMTQSKIAWDVTRDDSVMNRLLIMAYDDVSQNQHRVLDAYRQKITDREHRDHSQAQKKEKSITDSVLWKSIGADEPIRNFAPLWNMKSDCRGLLVISQGKAPVDFFRHCVQFKLLQRTYLVLVERIVQKNASQSNNSLPDTIEGYTLRSDLFWSPAQEKPRYEERIYTLFLPDPQAARNPHPWLLPNEHLTILPSEKIGQHRGKYFRIRPKLVQTHLLSEDEETQRIREVFRVELIEGNEEAMRCAFAHFGHPIVNDVRYNTAFARKTLREAGIVHPCERDSKKTHGEIERFLLEKALQPLTSNYLHLGMCCCKVMFPDPDNKSNQRQIERAQIMADTGDSRKASFSDNLNCTTLELPTPPEFSAWASGERIPGIAAKSGTKPITDIRAVGKRFIDSKFIHRNSVEDGDEDVVMVRGGGDAQLVADSPREGKFLRHGLVQCSESVEVVRKDGSERKALGSSRSALLCRHCGDFHSEQNCALVPTADVNSLVAYKEFYARSAQGSGKTAFCITCGVFGHVFRNCVHSYSRFRVITGNTKESPAVSDDSTKGSTKSFEKKYRQCQICQALDHKEINCVKKKPPPWGFDELGNPMNKTVKGITTPRKRFSTKFGA